MAMQTEPIRSGQEQATRENTCCTSSAARYAGQKVRDVLQGTSQKARQARFFRSQIG